MQGHRREKKRLDEISFVLQNIFIIHPTAGSKYKIRVVINRNNREQHFTKIHNRYIFQLPVDNNLAKNACFLCLLEKNRKSGGQGQYLEIGKAEIELGDAVEHTPVGNDSLVNGVIYGTRSFNYDRIIGKYSYKISIIKGEMQVKESRLEKSRKINFVDHKKKEKPPEFAFKKSIVEHTNEISNKIKQLEKSMNQILGNSKDEEDLEEHHDLAEVLPLIKQATFQQHDYYYKYNAKIEEQLKLADNCKNYKVLVIKNIRIQRQKQLIDPKDTFMKSPENKQPKKGMKLKKSQQFMLIFYQLLEDRKMKKRLLQIFMPLSYGTDNRFLINNLFYLPKGQKTILIELAVVTTAYNKDRSFNGVLSPSHAKSRLIELFDSAEEERGIFICQLDNCTQIDKEELKSYQKQVQKFDKFMRRYNCQFSHFVKKPTATSKVKEQSAKFQSKILDNQGKDTLYSQFHPKKHVTSLKRYRFSTETGKSLDMDVITPSVSRARDNFSVMSEKMRNRSATKGSFRFGQKSSSKRYPFDSSVGDVDVLKGQFFNQVNLDDLKNRYRLLLESVQLNFYGLSGKNKKVLIKFEMMEQSSVKKILMQSQKQGYPLNLQYKGKKIDDVLSISLLLNKKNTNHYYKLGKCHILLSEFKKSPSHKLKVFITSEGKVTANLYLNFRMLREKNDDEMTESFYYQQPFDRQRELISEDSKKYLKDAFQNYSQTEIPLPRSLEQESQEFQISVDSNKISVANNTEFQYISQKMSEKAPSEILEEEEYINGQAIRKKY